MNKTEIKMLRTSLRQIKEKRKSFLYYRLKGKHTQPPISITQGSFLVIADGTKTKKADLKKKRTQAKSTGGKIVGGKVVRRTVGSKKKITFIVASQALAMVLRKGLKRISSQNCSSLKDSKIQIIIKDEEHEEALDLQNADEKIARKRATKERRQEERLYRVQNEPLTIDELVDVAEHSGPAAEIAMTKLREKSMEKFREKAVDFDFEIDEELMDNIQEIILDRLDITEMTDMDQTTDHLLAYYWLVKDDIDGPDQMIDIFEGRLDEEPEYNSVETEALRLLYTSAINKRGEVKHLAENLGLSDAEVEGIMDMVIAQASQEELLAGEDVFTVDIIDALIKYNNHKKTARIDLLRDDDRALDVLQDAVTERVQSYLDLDQLDHDLLDGWEDQEALDEYVEKLTEKLGGSQLQEARDSNMETIVQSVIEAVEAQSRLIQGRKSMRGTVRGNTQNTARAITDRFDLGTVILTIGVKATDGTLLKAIQVAEEAGTALIVQIVKLIPEVQGVLESGAISAQDLESLVISSAQASPSGLQEAVKGCSVILNAGQIAVAGANAGLSLVSAVVEGAQTLHALEDYEAFSRAAKSQDEEIQEIASYAARKTRRKVAQHAISSTAQTVAGAAGAASVGALATGPGAAFLLPITGAVALGAGLTDVILTKIPKLGKAIWKKARGTKGKNRKKYANRLLRCLKGDKGDSAQREALILCIELGILKPDAKAKYFVDGGCDKLLLSSIMYHMKST